MPHRADVREEAETTKLRIVYDASTRLHSNALSLNECLHSGAPLQNKLWSVLIRNRFHTIAVAGRKTFVQVQIHETEVSTGLSTSIPKSRNASFYQNAVCIGPFVFPVLRCNPAAFRDLENSPSRERKPGV